MKPLKLNKNPSTNVYFYILTEINTRIWIFLIIYPFADYRNQINLASAFLEGSAIYGNTYQSVEALRTYDAGLINISACSSCRSNALYSAILKEHNRAAVILAHLNRHWTDDVLFYESKRIVSAEIQHITYNEFLPTLLGQVSYYISINSDMLIHYSTLKTNFP